MYTSMYVRHVCTPGTINKSVRNVDVGSICSVKHVVPASADELPLRVVGRSSVSGTLKVRSLATHSVVTQSADCSFMRPVQLSQAVK